MLAANFTLFLYVYLHTDRIWISYNANDYYECRCRGSSPIPRSSADADVAAVTRKTENLSVDSTSNPPRYCNLSVNSGIKVYYSVYAANTALSSSKGVATSSDGNEQNRSQVNTKLFRSSLDLPHKIEDTSCTKRWKERNVIVLQLS